MYLSSYYTGGTDEFVTHAAVSLEARRFCHQCYVVDDHRVLIETFLLHYHIENAASMDDIGHN